MPDKLNDIVAELALANRILANEGVLDAFGHVSARHPGDAGRYLLPRARSPGLVEPGDILEFTLDSGRSSRRKCTCTPSALFTAASIRRGPT